MTQLLRVSEAEVRAIPEPEFTKTWHPVAHGKLLDALDVAVSNHGLAIKSKNYTLGANGSRLFGTYAIDSGHSDRDFMFGFRHGLDKSMGIGMTAGNNIVVCGNMQFSGDYIAFRKHTGGLNMDELVWMADKAIETTMQKSKDFDDWHQGLKGRDMSKNNAGKAFAFDCMNKGVFAPSKFKAFIVACTEEYKISKERDLYTYHGGVTRLLRDTSLFNIADSTRKLVGVCDHYASLMAA